MAQEFPLKNTCPVNYAAYAAKVHGYVMPLQPHKSKVMKSASLSQPIQT